jgi:hypothetical protein
MPKSESLDDLLDRYAQVTNPEELETLERKIRFLRVQEGQST